MTKKKNITSAQKKKIPMMVSHVAASGSIEERACSKFNAAQVIYKPTNLTFGNSRSVCKSSKHKPSPRALHSSAFLCWLHLFFSLGFGFPNLHFHFISLSISRGLTKLCAWIPWAARDFFTFSGECLGFSEIVWALIVKSVVWAVF